MLQVNVEGLKCGWAPGAIPPWERCWQELGEPCPAWALGAAVLYRHEILLILTGSPLTGPGPSGRDLFLA